jgi:hypothetical protein
VRHRPLTVDVLVSGADLPSSVTISFDVELPFECDDEYWQTGSSATNFVQPAEHQPSRLTAFILTLQLQKIFSTILKELVRAVLEPEPQTATEADPTPGTAVQHEARARPIARRGRRVARAAAPGVA